MATLVIETATAACSVALLADGRRLASAHELVGRGHAERLVPMIGEVIDRAGRPGVTAILVDCGPGSFTGIRVGLAAARALALAWNVPVRGFSSMALIAAAADGADDAGAIAVAIAGGHGELFVQRFATGALAMREAIQSLLPAEAAAMVGEDRVHGSGAAALVAARGRGVAIAALPDAADAGRLPPALAGLAPSPLYIRAPDAALPA